MTQCMYGSQQRNYGSHFSLSSVRLSGFAGATTYLLGHLANPLQLSYVLTEEIKVGILHYERSRKSEL